MELKLMKKCFIICTIIILISVIVLFISGCKDNDVEYELETESQPMIEPIAIEVSTQEGLTYSDILYKGIPLSRLFNESFIDILGEPMDIWEDYLVYVDLESMSFIEGTSYKYEGLSIKAVDEKVIAIYGRLDLDLFDINRITLLRTRSDLIADFGVPLQDCERFLVFSISNSEENFTLNFMFSPSSINREKPSTFSLRRDISDIEGV